jgi:AcrR family transcriptional regulator
VSSAPARRSPGRPRDTAIDQAILLTTWELLSDVGYSALTMTAVAEGAGIQKPALYRRWATKPLLVVDAFAAHLPPLEYEDHGSLQADLRAFVAHLAQAWVTPATRRALVPLLADLAHDQTAAIALSEHLLHPRNLAYGQLISAAQARGEVRSDAPLSQIPSLLDGPLMHRAVLGAAAVDDDLVTSVVAAALALLAE